MKHRYLFYIAVPLFIGGQPLLAEILNKESLLEAQSFWDNRDWDWYKQNIPFFHCPDKEIETTYYYRWELVTKHLTYGSPESGYSFTEFIDRPFWSGAFGSISCPAGHQLYEVRWLRDKRYAQDYARYWFTTPGAQPRRYSTWLADAVWAVRLAQGDEAFASDLLPALINNYEGWEKSNFVPEIGLFWQIGHDDGMELNINSRQTKDLVRGAPGYRPSFNTYMWADAQAIAQIAERANDKQTAVKFRAKADALRKKVQSLLWDPQRNFFFHMFKNDEQGDGFLVKALTLTHQSGPFAGSPHGRELIGYVPWQFNMLDPGFEQAWQYLMDPEYFLADYGPTTVERHDPLFKISKTCCWWSGQSWPYATTQTLKGMANLLQNSSQTFISRADYLKLLKIYTRTQHKQGKPYIAEAANPDDGSWDGHDSYNHSEHYFHSGYCDLIITGLIGLKPRADDTIEIDPLAPEDWNYFALDDLPYHGHRLSVLWDKDGRQFGRGAGLQIFVDGKNVAAASKIMPLFAFSKVPPAPPSRQKPLARVNYAVNNDRRPFPKLSASFTNQNSSLAKLNDGNYWYHLHPPNRWTAENSTNLIDWVSIDFGMQRTVNTVKLYLLDDGEKVVPPSRIDLQYWKGKAWAEVPKQKRAPEEPAGHRANVITFPELATTKIRAGFTHATNGRAGLSEFEVWGEARLPIPRPP